MRLALLAGDTHLAPLLVREALQHGHEVSMLGAAALRPAVGHDRLHVVPGDLRDAGAVSDLIDGRDAVVVALADGSDADSLATAAKATLDAVRSMSRYGVRRLVALSSTTVTPAGEPGRAGLFNRIRDPLARGSVVADLRRMEVAVRRSGLAWTIVRAARLTDDPPRGPSRIRVGPGYNLPKDKPISRADVATFLVDELERDVHCGHAVAISG
jgi:putative NADH-flavin reductase